MKPAQGGQINDLQESSFLDGRRGRNVPYSGNLGQSLGADTKGLQAFAHLLVDFVP